ncbi:MAG: hypothetical protein WB476_04410 [Azonexus sp.]
MRGGKTHESEQRSPAADLRWRHATTLKAVIFDVDGTLADTEGAHRHHHLPGQCRRAARHHSGRSSGKLLRGDRRWRTGNGQQARTRHLPLGAQSAGTTGRSLAIEDSKNGVCAALGAGIPVLVTEGFWTGRDDFTGAMAVLPDLEGIGLARLKHWHAHIHLTKTEKPL